MTGEDYISRITWDEVGAYLNAVAQRVDPHDFTGVYGIPRGGSVLAAWLSHKLYLPLLSNPEPGCIIIDDICDSGKTLTECLNSSEAGDDCHNFITVMFYRKGSCDDSVDYFFKLKGDDWIVFPWEQ